MFEAPVGQERVRWQNTAVHRAAANDVDYRHPRGPRLRWNGLLCQVNRGL